MNEGGVERGAIEIGSAIVRAGGRALLATSGGRMAREFTAAGGEVIEMPLQRKGPMALRLNAGRLRRLIRREGVDLVHARSRAPAWAGLNAARRAKVPFVTTYHGTYNEGAPLKRRYNSVMAMGEPVIAVSDFIARLVAERHETPPERIVTIHRGADLRRFGPDLVSPERLGDLMEAWNIADDERPILLMPGRLTRWKGQEVFIEACARLREARGPAFLGLIVGGGGESGYLEELDRKIEATGTGDCVRIPGPCNDMPTAYKLAHAVVSASTDPEAFGRVAVEAQAMGKPVIASNHGGAAETIEHDITGILVPPGDADALAGAMAEVLDLSEEEQGWVHDAAIARVRLRRAAGTL